MPFRAATILLAVTLSLSAVPAASGDGPRSETVDPLWASQVHACQYERVLAAESHRGNLDIAFVGSSLAFRGIHSAQIDERLGDPDAEVQNIALPGQPIGVFGWWAAELALPVADPRVVVIAVASRDLVTGGTQQLLAGSRFEATPGREFVGSADFRYAVEQIEAGNRVAAFRAALRRPDLIDPPLTGAWDPVAAGYDPPGWQFHHMWPSQCNQTRYREQVVFTGSTGAQRERLQRRQLDPWDLTEGLRLLTRLVRQLKRAGITPVVVNLPVTPDYIAAHPNGAADYDAYRAAVEGIAVSEQILLVDAVEYFTVEQGVFKDMTHLNVWGARRFSRRLGSLLRHPAAPRVICLRCG
jgi:hypothetical protein